MNDRTIGTRDEWLEARHAYFTDLNSVGAKMRLAPPLSTEAKLTLEEARSLPEGAVEIVYACA